jgi:LDH2 family malate/lactate/ureidoglycolate dehydrogenase
MARRIFVAAGTPHDPAAHVARHLVRANLSGHDSHGVLRIPAYLRQIKQSQLVPGARPEVVREWAASAVVDGRRGFGQVTASFALDVAIRKAEGAGVGAASVRRCNHTGRLGEYGEAAAERGFIGLMTFGSAGPNGGLTAPFGGAARHLGTNPWTIGIPRRGGPPVVVDFATSAVAEGKIQVARAKHASLPEGCIVDKANQPSTDPEDFYAGGMLLPMGGHKGYGLSLVAALWGAALTAETAVTTGRGGGVFVLAINPRAFADDDVFADTIEGMASAVKAVPPAAGVDAVLLPGEPEARSRAAREVTGIPIPIETWEALVKAAAGLDVPVPATL